MSTQRGTPLISSPTMSILVISPNSSHTLTRLCTSTSALHYIHQINIKTSTLSHTSHKHNNKMMENSSSSSSSYSLYRECLRNHAASLGSYATDGCGEFTLDDTSSPSLQCAACGCHRNFHRKVATACLPAEGYHQLAAPTGSGELMEYSAGGTEGERSGGGSKKRFRTKFSAEQKEKMLVFAEKLGWKLQRKEVDDEIERFCRSVGVSRQVFKVWMHNHKNNSNSSANLSSLTQ